MSVISDAEVARVLDVDTAIASQRLAFTRLGEGRAQLAEKTAIRTGADTALSYLSRLSPEHGAVAKLVAVHPGNAGRGMPAVSGTVLVLDPETGHLVAVLAATALTALRTAAASAVAVDALAVAGAGVLAVLGSGVQARGHVRAISRVRPLREVRLHSRGAANREAAAAELTAELGVPVRPVPTADEAVSGADMIAACTLSEQPVVPTNSLSPGAAVVSVGSFEPHRHEVDGALLSSAGAIVVDDVSTAAEHAGPIRSALETGVLSRADLRPLGSVLTGALPARSDAEQIVFHNSVGIGVQDAAAAHAVLERLGS